MSTIHIICKRPPAPAPGPYSGTGPVLNGVLPSIADCEVTIDGVPATNVERITWTVGGAEPARAVVTFFDATVDVEGKTYDCKCGRLACGGRCGP